MRFAGRPLQSVKLPVNSAERGMKVLGGLNLGLCRLDLLSDKGNAFHGEGIRRPT